MYVMTGRANRPQAIDNAGRRAVVELPHARRFGRVITVDSPFVHLRMSFWVAGLVFLAPFKVGFLGRRLRL